jgi:hypothetical protein
MDNTRLIWLLPGILLGCLENINGATGGNCDSVALDTAADDCNYSFFTSDEPLNITLFLNLSEFLKTKKQPEYYPAEVAIVDKEDTVMTHVKIKARGFMRLSYCHIPPVFIKFSDKHTFVNGKQLSGTYKMVLPCMPCNKFEDYVLKEYLIYKLYNIVTPYSFMTRLIRLTLIDKGKKDKTYEAFGFLIEDVDDLAKRMNAIVVRNKNLCQRNMETVQMNLVTIFNYMVGNTDWSVPTLHNIKVLKTAGVYSNTGIPVPYDFDYAGMVDAMYAAPAEALPIKDVTERYFLGVCENNTGLKTAVSQFETMEDDILGTIENFGYLSDNDRKATYGYIKRFFNTHKTENTLVQTLTRTCRQY